MAPRTQLSFASFSLYNLNLPERPIYRDTDGWTLEEYDNHKETGTSDHGVIKANFEYRPI